MKTKHLFSLPVMLVLVCGLIFASLPEQAQAEEIKLVYTDHNPPTSYGTIHANAVWLDRLEKATNNRIKINKKNVTSPRMIHYHSS